MGQLCAQPPNARLNTQATVRIVVQGAHDVSHSHRRNAHLDAGRHRDRRPSLHRPVGSQRARRRAADGLCPRVPGCRRSRQAMAAVLTGRSGWERFTTRSGWWVACRSPEILSSPDARPTWHRPVHADQPTHTGAARRPVGPSSVSASLSSPRYCGRCRGHPPGVGI